MPTRAVVGVYDSYAKAEQAELRLEEAHLPVGQMSLIAPRMEDGEVKGDITAGDVAGTIAGTAIQLSEAQIIDYEGALKAGKRLLVFRGDETMVSKAYDALGNTDHDELTVLGG